MILLILLLSSFNGVSQTLSEKEIAKLNLLEIKTENLDLENTDVQRNLNTILQLERERKKNEAVGIGMVTASAYCLVLGGVFLSSNSSMLAIFGGAMVAGAVTCGGVSVPFWVSSRKKERERDELKSNSFF